MKHLKKYLLLFLILITIITIFKYNSIISMSVIDSVDIWLKKVFPSLFIMFILNDIIINYNIVNNLFPKLNSLFNKIYKTDGLAFNTLLLTIFSGTPSNAYIIKEMLTTHKISINTANKLISFTFFNNPLFLYNVLSITFSHPTTIKLIMIQYLSNMIVGLFFREKNSKKIEIVNTSFKRNIAVIPSAISKSMNTLLMILGTITFYMIITNIIVKIFQFNSLNTILIKGIFEITQSLSILNNLAYKGIIKEIIASSIISFGGLSIHTQIKSIIENTISYKNFLMGRILQLLISTIICFLTYCII